MNEEKYIIFEVIEDIFSQKTNVFVKDLNFLLFQ